MADDFEEMAIIREEYAESAVLHFGTGQEGGVPEVPTVIIDTDPGIDDAMALLCAFAAHKRGKINIIGITIVHGNNNDVDMLATNACFLLQVAGLADGTIPVVKGCNKPLAGDYHGFSGILVHGPNGLGGVPLPFEPTRKPLQDDIDAADFLISTCAARPGEVTVITLGPLTNIGTAVSRSPTFATTVKRIAMMGGDTHGAGNKAPSAEANIHNDPEAAKLMFKSVPDIVMCGLNVTKHVELSQRFREQLRDTCGDVGGFIYNITQHYTDLLTSWKVGRMVVHDACAVMIVLHPELFSGSRTCVDVETVGEITRGMTVADWANHWRREPQTFVAKNVDSRKFRELYVDYVRDFVGVTF